MRISQFNEDTTQTTLLNFIKSGEVNQNICTSIDNNDEVMKHHEVEDNESMPSSSSNQTESLIWLEDYKCSLCGVELPTTFVEERREHFDFHFAEKLQKEEQLAQNNRGFSPKQRYV